MQQCVTFVDYLWDLLVACYTFVVIDADILISPASKGLKHTSCQFTQFDLINLIYTKLKKVKNTLKRHVKYIKMLFNFVVLNMLKFELKSYQKYESKHSFLNGAKKESKKSKLK